MKRFLEFTAVLLPLACSGGKGSGATPDQPGDDRLIVPEALTVTALSGGNGVLEVTALTLLKGAKNIEIYAALANVGDTPACSAALSVELFDAAEQSLAAGINGLLSSHYYRLTDGSGTVAACIGPGDVTMAAITDLPADVALDQVAHVLYRCPYFALEVETIPGLEIRDVKSVSGAEGVAYTGTFVNGLTRAVMNPSVTVFPVTRVGRPLGVVIARDTVQIEPGQSWAFETSAVAARGANQAAFPAAALVQE